MGDCDLIFASEGVAVGFTVGDMISSLVSRCGRSEMRQLIAEFVVSQSIGDRHDFMVVASDENHVFDIPSEDAKAILCDFPVEMSELVNLENWQFTVIDASKVTGRHSAKDISSCGLDSDFFMLYKHLPC